MARARASAQDNYQHLRFPGESTAYRTARNKLLKQEMDLRRQVEHVAQQRRKLPAGGVVPEDYRFEGKDGETRLSQLFAPDKNTLAIYSFMFGLDSDGPCPMCAHFLDQLDGAAEHIDQRLNLVVVAKVPIQRLLDFARTRGWRHLVLLSTAGNNYDRDYFGDSQGLSEDMRRQQQFEPGQQSEMPMLNIFRRDDTTIRHFWGSELLYVPPEPGQDPRHNDLLDPLWNMLDLTPEGRGDFITKLRYN